MSYVESHEDRSETYITDIITDGSMDLAFEEITFDPYGNPNLSIDSSARFAVHEIIGGTTVRQKIGEDPLEISISGVCTEEVAGQIDALHYARSVKLISERLPNGVTCQVGSISTSPLEDGGAANLDEGEFLYEFGISLVEISTT